MVDNEIMKSLDLNTVKVIRHMIAGRLSNLNGMPSDMRKIITRDCPVILNSKVNEKRRLVLEEMLFVCDRDARKINEILIDIQDSLIEMSE